MLLEKIYSQFRISFSPILCFSYIFLDQNIFFPISVFLCGIENQYGSDNVNSAGNFNTNHVKVFGLIDYNHFAG